jgi:hypothetical protein
MSGLQMGPIYILYTADSLDATHCHEFEVPGTLEKASSILLASAKAKNHFYPLGGSVRLSTSTLGLSSTDTRMASPSRKGSRKCNGHLRVRQNRQ